MADTVADMDLSMFFFGISRVFFLFLSDLFWIYRWIFFDFLVKSF